MQILFILFKVLIEHKENCLITNGKQSVKLKCGSISFKNYFKLLPVPFKIYVDFECLLKGVKSSNKNNGSYSEKYQEHIPRSEFLKLLKQKEADSYEYIDSFKKFSEKMIDVSFLVL